MAQVRLFGYCNKEIEQLIDQLPLAVHIYALKGLQLINNNHRSNLPGCQFRKFALHNNKRVQFFTFKPFEDLCSQLENL